ncbi:hypothetical protein AAKU55_003667 [Oxalobacteraceae bacterium GrIS 1.11]
MDPLSHSHTPRRHRPRSTFLMHITVDTASLSALRQLLITTCGPTLSFMRIEAVDHAERMRVRLCAPQAAMQLMMDAVMRRLPAAEFGRISRELAS